MTKTEQKNRMRTRGMRGLALIGTLLLLPAAPADGTAVAAAVSYVGYAEVDRGCETWATMDMEPADDEGRIVVNFHAVETVNNPNAEGCQSVWDFFVVVRQVGPDRWQGASESAWYNNIECWSGGDMVWHGVAGAVGSFEGDLRMECRGDPYDPENYNSIRFSLSGVNEPGSGACDAVDVQAPVGNGRPSPCEDQKLLAVQPRAIVPVQ